MHTKVLNDLAGLAAAMILVAIAGCVSGQRAEVGERPKLVAARIVWSFDGDSVGEVPTGWSVCETNPTEALATWRVIEDATAPSGRRVFALTESRNYDGTYNLAVADGTSYKDLDLTVRVKAVSGEEDQGGGPIWRAADANNYYICRFNPLESNYRVYVVKDGRRRQLESAKIDLEAGRWCAIRVTMVGDHITCYLDGRKMLEATDDTFPNPGMIGLWTKADAVTSFDDLRVRVITDR